MKLLRVLGGEVVWPPPAWLMRQAGRYLPEYRTVRAEAGDFLSLCLTPKLAAEVALQPIRKFGFDAAILFSDILILPMALGQPLRFAEGEGPRLPPLQNLAELRPEAATRIYAPVLQTIADLRAKLPRETALIGFAGGPATVACYMLEGEGGSGFPRTRALAYQDPDFVQSLLDLLTDATITYLQGQITAGADCLMLFESWAGLFAPAQFRRFVIAPTKRIVSALKAANPGIRIIGFPRLAGLMLGDYARETGLDAIGLDSHTDIADAAQICPPQTIFQGNLDPLLLKLGGTPMEDATRTLLAAVRHRPHIVNLGHGITPDAPEAHVTRLMELIRHG